MKLPDGIQYEVWAPESDDPFPKVIKYIGFDRDAAIAEVDRLLALPISIGEHLDIVVGEGFEVYTITPEQLRDTA